MKAIFNTSTNKVLGYTSDSNFVTLDDQVLVDIPSNWDESLRDITSIVNGSLSVDANLSLANSKAARISLIKSEAANLISATDWKLQRAKEQSDAGWTALSKVDEILVERESIRRSSTLAEASVNALTDHKLVTAFTWTVDSTLVTSPKRLTQTEFIKLFTDAELDTIRTNPSIATWWEKFKLADYISLTDLSVIAGIDALTQIGILASGRDSRILAGLTP